MMGLECLALENLSKSISHHVVVVVAVVMSAINAKSSGDFMND
jgi:hypothetical protein